LRELLVGGGEHEKIRVFVKRGEKKGFELHERKK